MLRTRKWTKFAWPALEETGSAPMDHLARIRVREYRPAGEGTHGPPRTVHRTNPAFRSALTVISPAAPLPRRPAPVPKPRISACSPPRPLLETTAPSSPPSKRGSVLILFFWIRQEQKGN